jgi:hypothetical protein
MISVRDVEERLIKEWNKICGETPKTGKKEKFSVGSKAHGKRLSIKAGTCLHAPGMPGAGGGDHI